MDYFTTPPPPPTRDDPDNFAVKGAAMMSYFETFIDEANTFGEVMNANAVTSQSSIDFAQVVLAAANYAGVWADLTGSLNTPASVYRNDKFWFLMVNLADVTASEPGVDPEWGVITIWDVVKTPSPQTPIMSSVNQSTLPELRADAYAHIYPSVAREYRTFQVDVVAGDFSSPVYAVNIDADYHIMETYLTTETEYKWRCRDLAVSGQYSRWCTPQTFTTAAIVVERPTLTVTGASTDQVPRVPLMETGAFSTDGGIDTHLNTDWQVLSGSTVLWESLADTTNKLSIRFEGDFFTEETEYSFRVRHRGTTFGASEWDTVVADTVAAFYAPTLSVTGATTDEVPEFPTLSTDAYAGADTHSSTDWQILESDMVIWQEMASTSKLSIQYTGLLLEESTEYEFKARHNGSLYGSTEWASVTGTTKAVFNVYPEDEIVKLYAADGAASDSFGTSVDIDGDTLIVGAYMASPGETTNAGAAYIFIKNGSTWELQQKIYAPDKAASDYFGWSVGISGDSVIVGAYSSDPGAVAAAGSAYVFVRSEGVWSYQATLTASDKATNDRFGFSVSIDGDAAIVGASVANAAYIFNRSGVTWTETQILTSASTGSFGSSVDIDGDYAVIGAKSTTVGAYSNAGSAHVFFLDGTWAEQDTFNSYSPTATAYFGTSVSIDGDTIIVGEPNADPGAKANAGRAMVFTRSGTSWSSQAVLISSDYAASDVFGTSVSVSGHFAIIGAPGDASSAGSAYVFQRNPALSTWAEVKKLRASDTATTDVFGISVAIDSVTAIIGAQNEDPGGVNDAGSAYVFA